MKQCRFFLMLLAIGLVYPVHAQKTQVVGLTGSVQVNSEPAGAKVYINGKLVCPSTPGLVPLQGELTFYYGKKKDDEMYKKRVADENKITLQFVKDGYLLGTETISPVVSYTRLPMMPLQMNAVYPNSVLHIFTPDPHAPASPDTSIPRGEANRSVSRDNPGQTALERTIIRWYFESQPQGARIFWRVISSVPDQVKNTNENWLGNTPFEETRSFNIQGLTYENSRDVQIEIKVRRPGYLDQTKRFNVRQAIDQQEISSFFDMVKADE